jgi:hypothetical protein
MHVHALGLQSSYQWAAKIDQGFGQASNQKDFHLAFTLVASRSSSQAANINTGHK